MRKRGLLKTSLLVILLVVVLAVIIITMRANISGRHNQAGTDTDAL